MYMDLFRKMKKNDLIKIIELVVRKEVKKQMNENSKQITKKNCFFAFNYYHINTQN